MGRMARKFARHNYTRPLLAHINELKPKPGTVRHIEVRHDDWCPFYRGTGPSCTCKPNIVSGQAIDRKHSAERKRGRNR